ncbi:MAG: TIGR04283 family arsenosugar biosynthesis glycosyltransferase [Gammaproteobacteria bacterium]
MTDFKRLSIVIPVGPSDQTWRKLLEELKTFGGAPEIILSACQAQPNECILPDNARWLSTGQGRALQLNAGAKQASRDIVWFVHADTRLTKEVGSELRRFIHTGPRKLGYFKLQFSGDGPWLTRLNAWAANLRSNLFGLPFGDQGFILHRTDFEQMQGFDERVILGEDLDFVVRIKAAGFSLCELSAMLETSARRYKHQGWLRTTFRHVWLTWHLTRLAKRRLDSNKKLSQLHDTR